MPEAPDLSREVILGGDGLSPALVRVLGEGGITAVLLTRPDEALARACAEARIQVLPAERFPFCALPEIARADRAAPAVFTGGLSPGVTRLKAGSNVTLAGATGQVWVDANIHWVAWLRALYPGRPALLGERFGEGPAAADKRMPLEVLELALADARIAGGNRILALAPQARQALLQGEPRALAAWKQLGRTAGWWREHQRLFGGPVVPTVTQLVDEHEATPELANLLHRYNVSPRLVSAADPPSPGAGIRVLVAAGIHQPGAAVRSRILAHTSEGGIVVTDAAREYAWWSREAMRLVHTDEDRRIYAMGSGQLVAYNEPIAEPGLFALDIIDLVSHRRRAVRIWDAPAAIALVTSGSDAGPVGSRAVLAIVNYGSPVEGEALAHVHGAFNQATLIRPESRPSDLKVARRGAVTEIFLPGLRRAAAVLFT